MPPRPGLSKAELEIARIVWELKDAGVRQVFEALPPGRDIDFTTVKNTEFRDFGKRYRVIMGPFRSRGNYRLVKTIAFLHTLGQCITIYRTNPILGIHFP